MAQRRCDELGGAAGFYHLVADEGRLLRVQQARCWVTDHRSDHESETYPELSCADATF